MPVCRVPDRPVVYDHGGSAQIIAQRTEGETDVVNVLPVHGGMNRELVGGWDIYVYIDTKGTLIIYRCIRVEANFSACF